MSETRLGVTLLLIVRVTLCHGTQEGNNVILTEDEAPRFVGNNTHRNHFTVLSKKEDSVLIGGRNVIYMLRVPGLEEMVDERIHWECSTQAEQLCLLKGRTSEQCGNYVRVFAHLGPGLVMVCGTHCYSPMCRHYRRESQGGHSLLREFSGRGYAPFQPGHNSSYLYTRGSLYSATVSDFSGTDSLIIKNQLRTEQSDYTHLNAPDFVSSMEDEDHVYFFFRESAVEFMNCGKSVYSRVARVCKNDEGGSHKFANRWTTFLKSRLNCSLPGEFPFYFDNIQSTSELHTEGDQTVFYAVFTTPTNSIPGSAICRFTLDDLNTSFNGNFKEQATVNSNWLPVSPINVPHPRPGQCNNDSSSLSESSLHFIKNHCLMDSAVSSSPSSPVYLRTGHSELLTQLVHHPGHHPNDQPGIKTISQDFLYVATNRGKVLRIKLLPGGSSQLVEEIQVYSGSVAVLDLVLPSFSSSHLLVISSDVVVSLPLARCNLTTCKDCLAIEHSPYCGWDPVVSVCQMYTLPPSPTSIIVQDPASCPPPSDTSSGSTSLHDVQDSPDTSTQTHGSTISPLLAVSHTLSPPAPCPSCPCPSCLPPSLTIPLSVAPRNTLESVTGNRTTTSISQPEMELLAKYESAKETESPPCGQKLQSHPIVILVSTSVLSLIVGFILGVIVSRMCRRRSSVSVTSSKVSLVTSPSDKSPTSSGANSVTSIEEQCSVGGDGSVSVSGGTSGKQGRKTESWPRFSYTGTLQKVKRIYL